ncbi:apolipoprotein N-acyltransferase [Ectothiorhodospira mobilis]|uniref:apolipoprotein N-acyltransferase n=1 Tax=Ectothiorhodospira mobilis TaxID=195064 RepID=UPI001EE7DC16|nr:apolipoprotein N-acyltransferase [Ectothiorhodospira mobilis]MCG5536399.1 apolipoprotein N-acyltransferase [Ectothiorhodospira mobilis]
MPTPTPSVSPSWTGILERHTRLAALGALLAGVVTVLAFAPFGWRPLAVAGPALLFILWAGASPKQAGLRGYAFGAGFFGAGVYWIYYSLHLFGSAIAPLAALITAGFVLFLALFPALLGWLAARLRPGLPRPLWLMGLVPALWVLLEWVRGWLFTGFPWLRLGTAQLDTPLAGYLPLLGELGGSAVAAVLAGALAWILVEGRRGAPALAVVLLLGAAGAGLGQVQWTRPAGPTLSASLLQGNVAQEDKIDPAQLPLSMDRYRRLSLEAAGSDLILWPETAVPAFYDQLQAPLLDPLARRLEEEGSALIIGVFTYDPETGAMYNSIARVGGEDPAVYHKRKRVPFGEYLPLRGLLAWLDAYIQLPMADLSRGHGGWTLEAAGITLGPSICYEDAFGAQTIRALPEARLLVNVTNDAWFGDSIAPHQHLEIARVRAVETGRPMLRATNTGVSAVIGHRGEVLARSPQFTTHILTARVQPRAGITPYARWGDGPVVVTAALAAVLLPLAGRRRRLSPGRA